MSPQCEYVRLKRQVDRRAVMLQVPLHCLSAALTWELTCRSVQSCLGVLAVLQCCTTNCSTSHACRQCTSTIRHTCQTEIRNQNQTVPCSRQSCKGVGSWLQLQVCWLALCCTAAAVLLLLLNATGSARSQDATAASMVTCFLLSCIRFAMIDTCSCSAQGTGQDSPAALAGPARSCPYTCYVI